MLRSPTFPCTDEIRLLAGPILACGPRSAVLSTLEREAKGGLLGQIVRTSIVMLLTMPGESDRPTCIKTISKARTALEARVDTCSIFLSRCIGKEMYLDLASSFPMQSVLLFTLQPHLTSPTPTLESSMPHKISGGPKQSNEPLIKVFEYAFDLIIYAL